MLLSFGFNFKDLMCLRISLYELWSGPIFSLNLFKDFILVIADYGNVLAIWLSIIEIKPSVAYDLITIFKLGSLEKVNIKAIKLTRGLTSYIEQIRMLTNLPFSRDLLPFDLFR